MRVCAARFLLVCACRQAVTVLGFLNFPHLCTGRVLTNYDRCFLTAIPPDTGWLDRDMV